jgi:hypothetical protein
MNAHWGGRADAGHRGDGSMSDEEAKRDELIRLLAGVPAKATELESLGQGLVQSARLASDTAAPLLEIVKRIPSESLVSGRLDTEITAWRTWYDTAAQARGAETMVNTFVAAASGAINTAVSGAASISFTLPLVPDQQAVSAARMRLFDTLNRSPIVASLRLSMTRLGLDKRGGKDRPALDLLEEAAGAMERPPVPGGRPASVLIPLRGAIEAAIDELMRRRPQQEPASGWSDKVASIGRLCGHSYLAPSYFPSLCGTITPLWKKLSGAKQDDLTREAVAELFSQGVAFLNALMDGIDERVLKP